jgi:chemotaxis protein MotB
MLKRIVLLGLGVCLMGSVGCTELKNLRKANASMRAQLTSVQAERDQLTEANRALQAELEASQRALAESKGEGRRMTQVIGEMKAEQDKLNTQTAELKKLLGDLNIPVEQRAEGNFIVMESEVLFDSGKVELKPQAQASLDKVAGYLVSHPAIPIRIDGHTDGVPIQQSPWKSNYHLGAMRALAVMDYLASKGVDSERMYVTGFGPNRPRVTPERPAASVAANRRVEILVVPEGVRSIGEILEGLKS